MGRMGVLAMFFVIIALLLPIVGEAGLVVSWNVLSRGIPVSDVSWSSDGKYFVVASGHGVYLFRYDGVYRGWIGFDGDVLSVSWCPCGDRFAVLVLENSYMFSFAGRVYIVGVNGSVIGSVVFSISKAGAGFRSFSLVYGWSPDGGLLAVANGSVVRVVDTGGRLVWERRLGTGVRPIVSSYISWGPSGSLLVASDGDNVTVFDRSGMVVGSFDVDGLAAWVSPDSRYLLVAERSRRLVLLDVRSGESVWARNVSGRFYPVEAFWTGLDRGVVLLGDGRLLGFSVDGRVFPVLPGWSVIDVSWDPRGGRLAVATSGYRVWILGSRFSVERVLQPPYPDVTLRPLKGVVEWSPKGSLFVGYNLYGLGPSLLGGFAVYDARFDLLFDALGGGLPFPSRVGACFLPPDTIVEPFYLGLYGGLSLYNLSANRLVGIVNSFPYNDGTLNVIPRLCTSVPLHGSLACVAYRGVLVFPAPPGSETGYSIVWLDRHLHLERIIDLEVKGSPVWLGASPLGDRLALISNLYNDSGGVRAWLWLYDENGSTVFSGNVSSIIENSTGAPPVSSYMRVVSALWSPDSTRLAMLVVNGDYNYVYVNGSARIDYYVIVLDKNGGTVYTLNHTATTRISDLQNLSMAWSVDGTMIAASLPGLVVIVDLENRSTSWINRSVHQVLWVPGTRILTLVTGPNNTRIETVRPSGSLLWRYNISPIRGVVWDPLGRYLAVISGENQSYELVVLDRSGSPIGTMPLPAKISWALTSYSSNCFRMLQWVRGSFMVAVPYVGLLGFTVGGNASLPGFPSDTVDIILDPPPSPLRPVRMPGEAYWKQKPCDANDNDASTWLVPPDRTGGHSRGGLLFSWLPAVSALGFILLRVFLREQS